MSAARHSCAFTGLGKWRISASVTKQKEEEKKLFCISASVQEDKFDELLGHSRLFLMLNMHPNTAFWQPNRGAGANTRWGSGTKCYRKYGYAAQSTTWTEAFGRWVMMFLKYSSNTDCSSRCDTTRWGSSTEDAHLKWEWEHHCCQL